jgi:RNA polymerase sigma-70 factor (ECF subfamily)
MTIASTTLKGEQELLEAAQGGDEGSFRRIAERHRAELHAHCYRMLGSLEDAEDALQETLLRAWRGMAGFEGRSSSRSWLYRIATNACLDAIARRPKRVLPVDYGPPSDDHDPGEPLVESVWVEPYPDETLGLEEGYAAPEARYEQREAVELAFVAALQHLPARQRAVLILREVLGFSAREVSQSLDTTVASVNSALQRARKTIDERLPQRSQQATLRSIGDQRISELVEGYVEAWARGDVDALHALLTADAVFSMPPWASWWRGRETIAAMASAAVEVCGESRTVPTRANGQPAIAYYGESDEPGPKKGRDTASAIDVITFDGARISEITAFVTPEIFPRFGLPSVLAP